MLGFWKSSPSWLKRKSRLRAEEDQHNLLPSKKSRRQTWLLGDGNRRSTKPRPTSLAVDGRFSGFDLSASQACNNNGRNKNKRATVYLEFLAPEPSHPHSSGRAESQGPTNVRYSSFFDHKVSWDRFM